MNIRELLGTCSLPQQIGGQAPVPNILNEEACMFRNSWLLIGTSLSIFATSNIGLVVNILHKICSTLRILIHIKANPFVKYYQLHQEYAANLVASSEYYHYHWVLFDLYSTGLFEFHWHLDKNVCTTASEYSKKDMGSCKSTNKHTVTTAKQGTTKAHAYIIGYN